MGSEQLTTAFLRYEYVQLCKSTCQIAREIGVDATVVRRAILKSKLKLRSRSEAQKTALRLGRRQSGKFRDDSVKERISDSMTRYWETVTPERRKAHSEKAKDTWAKLPEKHKAKIQKKAMAAVHRASYKGSRLENAIFEALNEKGYQVLKRKKGADLFLPDLSVVIVVDGPSHFSPIYGHERLVEIQLADAQRDTKFRQDGLRLIRIKHMAQNLSDGRIRKTLTKILSACIMGDSLETIVEIV